MADFEQQLKSLESVVDRLERGDLTLEDSVKLFEEGLKLSEACKRELEAAEGKIQILLEKGDGKGSDKGSGGSVIRDLDLGPNQSSV